MIYLTYCFFDLVLFLLLSFSYFILGTVMGLRCCPWAFSHYGEWGLLSSCSVQASYCRAQARGMQASVAVAWELSSCGAQA